MVSGGREQLLARVVILGQRTYSASTLASNPQATWVGPIAANVVPFANASPRSAQTVADTLFIDLLLLLLKQLPNIDLQTRRHVALDVQLPRRKCHAIDNCLSNISRRILPGFAFANLR